MPSTVLDPFCGSATTLLVARELGHHGVGLDLSLDYLRNIARERLSLAALTRWTEGAAPRHETHTDLPLFALDARA
jgi:DNA modification methylase